MHKHLMCLQSGDRVWQSNPRWVTKTGTHLRNNLRIIISCLLIKKISYAQNYIPALQSVELNLQISRTFWVVVLRQRRSVWSNTRKDVTVASWWHKKKTKMCCLSSPRQCRMSQTTLSSDPAPAQNMYWYCLWSGLQAFSLHCYWLCSVCSWYLTTDQFEKSTSQFFHLLWVEVIW